MDDLDVFDHFFTAHDLVLRTGVRQRSPLQQPGDAKEQFLDSFRRMLGQDGLVRIRGGIADLDDSDSEPSDIDEPRGIDPGFLQLPGGKLGRLPGGGDPGWIVKGPLPIDRGIDRDKLIDHGVAWVTPGTDPFHPNPGALMRPEPYFLRDHTGSSTSLVKLLGDRTGPAQQPGATDSVMVPESSRRAARLAPPRVNASSTALMFRSPAPGSRSPSQPPGAGDSSEFRSNAGSAPLGEAEPGTPGNRVAVNVQPTPTFVERMVSGAIEKATSHAESAAEMSVDQLRQEIFNSQTARNSLLPR